MLKAAAMGSSRTLSFGNPAEFGGETHEVVEMERLSAIGQRTVGIGMNLQHHTVRADGTGGPGKRSHVFPSTGSMTRIDDDWKMGSFPQHRDGREVKGIARRGFERPDSAF